MLLSKKWLFVLLWLVLPACEQRMLRPVEQYRPDLSRYQIKQWSMDGRVAVQTVKDSFSATLSWRHLQGEDVLELSGPLGQGRTIIRSWPDRVVVDDGDQERLYFQSAEAVFRRYFSVSFPVSAVGYWLLGVADPGLPVVLTQTGFVQNGWRVEYLQDQEVGKVFLPRKIRLSKQQTRIKLIIDQWNIQ